MRREIEIEIDMEAKIHMQGKLILEGIRRWHCLLDYAGVLSAVPFPPRLRHLPRLLHLSVRLRCFLILLVLFGGCYLVGSRKWRICCDGYCRWIFCLLSIALHFLHLLNQCLWSTVPEYNSDFQGLFVALPWTTSSTRCFDLQNDTSNQRFAMKLEKHRSPSGNQE